METIRETIPKQAISMPLLWNGLVSQIILRDPPLFAAEVEVTQSYLVWVVVEAHPSRSPDPRGFPTNEELMLYGEKFVKR
jgi:hypothetical protein